ncbi:MAG: DUF2783 domain-containing protein [Rhizobiaceae bacterium]
MADLGSDRLGAAGDEFYADLIAAHEQFDAAGSARFNARLVLILANLVGDIDRLRDAIERASRNQNEAASGSGDP